jgi:hypothetical protein
MTAPHDLRNSPMLKTLEIVDGIAYFRPVGESTLVDTVELIHLAIGECRSRRADKLLVDGRGLAGVAIPSLVDRFLMMEQWAHKSSGMVVVVLVIHPEYIHPQKFGVRVAADFGLTADVYTSEPEALKWLVSVPTAI